ncbi:MAG: hypothetical protein LBR20_08120 [Propionibacteriaceae bacterium]|jgi:hypothetical protein|nr:hypothetical protein [Propionibacteriaceae bacterium]
MQLDVVKDWARAKAYLEKAMDKAFYVSFATVGADGVPTVTPIGSLVLNDDQTGFYMERFPRSIPANAAHNPNFCLLAENMKLRSAIKEFRNGGWGGLRLFGTLGEKREASAAEIGRIRDRLPFGHFKRGGGLLLANTVYVRDLSFRRAEALVAHFDRSSQTFTIL